VGVHLILKMSEVFEYGENDIRYPQIGVKIITMNQEYPLEDYELMRIDTGFDGPVLVPYGVFSYLCQDIELFGEMRPIIEFPDKELLRARAANVEIEIGNKLIDTQVWTYPKCDEFLVGLEVLNKLKILFDGIGKSIEIYW